MEQNLITRVLDESAALAREPEFLLHEELRDLVPYHSVLMALAQGKSSPAQLAKSTGIDVRGLNYHLNTLVELGYVQRRYPVTEAEPSTRSVRYALDDPLLRFWFRFVFPHQSVLRLLGPARGFVEVVRPELDAYFGRCFERLCRESLPLLYLREGVRAPFTVGEYWDCRSAGGRGRRPAGQLDRPGRMQVGRRVFASPRWLPNWTKKSAATPMPATPRLAAGLFVKTARARAKARLEGVCVHTLQELYDLDEVS